MILPSLVVLVLGSLSSALSPSRFRDWPSKLINPPVGVSVAMFSPQFFSQPLDHFSKSPNVSFQQRYWISDRHYKRGGPVIVLDSGESSGTNRLPFLNTGIVDILAKATGGLGVVLEHRYYGASIPVKNFTTDSMRWLTNEQALADSARFIENFRYNGIDLSGPRTKWIYYGGSYAGARAALMKVIYPNLVFGAIASSAVTKAIVNYWEYYEAIRITANQTCTSLLSDAIASIDTSLDDPDKNSPLKAAFGLTGLNDVDFGAVLAIVPSSVQDLNWDATISDSTWYGFCEALVSGNATVHGLSKTVRTAAAVVNFASWIQANIVEAYGCTGNAVLCFGSPDPSSYNVTDLSQTWRSWSWQFCTTWGFFATAPPDPKHPRIVSKTQTLESQSSFCGYAFPPGKHASVPNTPNVAAVNKYGGFNIVHDRLAFIDGYLDPWRMATPHSPTAPKRKDTPQRPWKLIQTGVHHWDENGLANPSQEPIEIGAIHAQEVAFVMKWLGMK